MLYTNGLLQLRGCYYSAFSVAQEAEETARVAKEMVYGTTSRPVDKVGQPKSKANPPRAYTPKTNDTPQGKSPIVAKPFGM